MPGMNDPIDLSGIANSGPPGGGMSTNLLNSASASQDPLLFIGWAKRRRTTVTTRPRGGGQALDGEGSDARHVRVVPHQMDAQGQFHHTPVLKTPGQMLRVFDGFSRTEYLRFRNKLIAAGIVPENADPASVRSAYAGLLADMADVQATKGAHTVTPFDYVNNLIRLNGLDPSKIGANPDYHLASSSAAKNTTQTQKTVYDLDPATARLMLQQTLQQKLGRDPSEAEIQDFIDAARTKAADDPSISKTKYHTDAQGNTVATTNTVSDGFGADDAQVMAENRAKKAPDYKSYQAVSTYFPALLSALGSTV